MDNTYLMSWHSRIINAIDDISNLEIQKESWIEGNTQYISSFNEMINILYDDLEFEEYLRYIEHHEMLKNKFLIMTNLNIEINNYIKNDLTDEEILKDPKWKRISDLAKKIVFENNKTIT